MSDWLPLLTTIGGAVLGFVARREYSRFTRRGRLPGNITAQLDMLEKLPNSETRQALLEHVERQVRYLIAYEQPATVKDRLAFFDHASILGGGIGLVGLALNDFLSAPFRYVTGLLGLALVLVGGNRLSDHLGLRAAARLRRLHDIETRATATPPGAAPPAQD